jgi:hypothetical protein
MLIATTVFAVIAALSSLLGFSGVMSTITGLFLLFVVPVVLGTLAYYSRGEFQTFFGGAFAGSLSAHYLLRAIGFAGSIMQLAVYAAALAIVVAICGATALHTRRFLERRGWNRPRADE